MTKVLINNRYKQIVFESMTAALKSLKVTEGILRRALNSGEPFWDRDGNIWYADILEDKK